MAALLVGRWWTAGRTGPDSSILDNAPRVRSDAARPMKRSTDRILTTHTGRLPRPADLAATLEALDAGAAVDAAAFEARVRRAVADVVRRQVEAGVDVVSDG